MDTILNVEVFQLGMYGDVELLIQQYIGETGSVPPSSAIEGMQRIAAGRDFDRGQVERRVRAQRMVQQGHAQSPLKPTGVTDPYVANILAERDERELEERIEAGRRPQEGGFLRILKGLYDAIVR